MWDRTPPTDERMVRETKNDIVVGRGMSWNSGLELRREEEIGGLEFHVWELVVIGFREERWNLRG